VVHLGNRDRPDCAHRPPTGGHLGCSMAVYSFNVRPLAAGKVFESPGRHSSTSKNPGAFIAQPHSLNHISESKPRPHRQGFWRSPSARRGPHRPEEQDHSALGLTWNPAIGSQGAENQVGLAMLQIKRSTLNDTHQSVTSKLAQRARLACRVLLLSDYAV
jgi:hypothetical protein